MEKEKLPNFPTKYTIQNYTRIRSDIVDIRL